MDKLLLALACRSVRSFDNGGYFLRRSGNESYILSRFENRDYFRVVLATMVIGASFWQRKLLLHRLQAGVIFASYWQRKVFVIDNGNYLKDLDN